MLHPAKAVHWDGSAGDEEVIVEAIGYGPSGTTPLDPSQPFWVGTSTSEGVGRSADYARRAVSAEGRK